MVTDNTFYKMTGRFGRHELKLSDEMDRHLPHINQVRGIECNVGTR